MGHCRKITIARKTLPFLKKNYTISRDRKLQNRATFCKLRSQKKLYHFSRKPIQFILITNCRNGPVSANYDRKKGYTISRDCELQKWFSFWKLRLQEKFYHFSRETIQFLVIANCRNGPLSANYDRKKTYKISQEKIYKFSGSRIAEKRHFLQITIARKTRPFLKKNYTISPDRKLQNRATFCKLRSQEKLDHFSRKSIQFLVIVKCRNGPLSANYDRKKNFTISQEKPYNFS